MKNSAATVSARSAAPAEIFARSRSRRRRFLVVSVTALAVMAVTMGVSFLDQSGATTLEVSAGSGNDLVFPIGSGSTALPVGDGSHPLVNTVYTSGPATVVGSGSCDSTYVGTKACDTGSNKATSSTLSAGNLPSWSPTANSPGSVTTHGDIAVIDATQISSSANVIVNLYITNLAALSKDYSSFTFPVNVYQATPTSNLTAVTWNAASSIVTQSPFASFLTDTTGVLSFALPGGKFYELTMEGPSDPGAGGSFFCISTTASGGSLSPSFFITANPTA